MAYEKPKLSPWEILTLIYGILRALNNGFWATVTAPFRGSSYSKKFSNHVRLAMLRSFVKHTTVRHQQALAPTIDEAYFEFAKKKGFTPQSVTASDGTKAYWLGKPTAEKVILCFHGGGYNLPPDPGHLPYLSTLVTPTVSVLVLSYTLAPHATYPTQLRQAISLVRHMVNDLHYPPSSISLAGDSAGANLSLGVLSHILHPHPSIPALELDQPLQSAILVAPWASFSTTYASMRTNANKDVVSAVAGNRWSSSFLGGAAKDAYNEPLSAPEGWWKGLDGVVDQVFICGGADEVLVDVIREVDRRIREVQEEGKVVTVVADGEWHDQPILQLLGAGGVQAEAVREFVKGRL